MKYAKTISELAVEIERQTKAKRDLIVRTSAMKMEVTEEKEPRMAIGDLPENVFPMNAVAHDQIGSHVKIPAPYYDRMLAEAPALLATNVNTWLNSTEEKRMVRVLDNRMRSFNSDKFRPLENFDLMEAILPPLMQSGAEIVSCEVTDRRLYIKAVDKTVQQEIERKTGHRIGDGSHAFYKDILCPAIVVSNSEVGLGALSVRSSVWTEGCTNFAVLKEHSVRKSHVGGRHELLGEQIMAVLSDRTRRLKDAALWSEITDVVKTSFDRAKFDATVKRISGMVDQKIEGNPVEAIEMTRRLFGMNDGESTSMMQHLIQGGDLSRYGLFNAITRTAEDLDSYDRASEFEKFGGALIELAPQEWKRIAEAA